VSRHLHDLPSFPTRRSSDLTRLFAELAAERLVRELPGLATTEWLKRKREGVYLDARQNGWGKTIASVYSVRPRDGAPVSTPLAWDELTEALDPRSLGLREALARVER